MDGKEGALPARLQGPAGRLPAPHGRALDGGLTPPFLATSIAAILSTSWQRAGAGDAVRAAWLGSG